MQREQFDLHAEIEERHWWFVARRTILATLVRELAAPGRGLRVVDVGCGTGANLAALAGEYECFGIDSSEDAIRQARRRFPELRFEPLAEVSEATPLLAGAAVVILADVLEHIADDRGFLGDVVRQTAPGAHVLITVPAVPALWSPHDVAFGHYRRYERDTLAAAWAGQPVEVRLLSYYNVRLYPLVRAVRALTAWRGRAAGRAGTDFRLPPAWLNRLLTGVFAGERRRLVRQLQTRGGRPSGSGVSLIAVLRRLDEAAETPVAGRTAAGAPLPTIGSA